MTHDTQLLGILGGLGPMSTVYFYETITRHTKAVRDQDHLDILISSRASTPDRTAFIEGQSQESPLEAMLEEGRRLEAAGASLIAMPCNTAHFFYEALSSALRIPVLNIVEETVAYLHALGAGTVGILATDGTISADSYGRLCRRYGMNCLYPTPEEQCALMHCIYGEIKAGKEVDLPAFMAVADSLFDKGCQKLVLGCTELSLLGRDHALDNRFVDSLEVLACKTIAACGKAPVGFDADMLYHMSGETV